MTFVILSYCDTLQKQQLLKNLISGIKGKYPQHKILVYSHFSGVPQQVFSDCDFYLYDKSNPKSGRRYCHWIKIPPVQKRFDRWSDDWGFAVLEMISRSLKFVKSIGEEEVIVLNYDCDVSAVLDLDLECLLQQFTDGSGIIVDNWTLDGEVFSLTNFAVKLDRIPDAFFDTINLDWYCNFDYSMVAEHIWTQLIKSTFGKNFIHYPFGIREVASMTSRTISDTNPLFAYFSHLTFSKDSVTGKKCILAWDLKSPISEITFTLENQKVVCKNDVEDSNVFYSEISDTDFSQITFTKIDSVECHDILYDGLTTQYWTDNFHSPE